MNDTYSASREISSKDAPIVAKMVGAITKSKGRLSTKEMAVELVRVSRATSSPTHHLFEWDDRKAAEAHRIDRATQIIAAIVVEFEEQPERPPVRAFPVLVHDGKRGPVPMRQVLESRDLTSALLEEAKREMTIFTKRYEGLVELSEVFDAMEKVVARPPKKADAKVTTEVPRIFGG